MVSPPRESENLLHWQSDHDVPNRHIQGQRKSQQTTMFLPRPLHDCEMINNPFLLSNYSFFFFYWLPPPTSFLPPAFQRLLRHPAPKLPHCATAPKPELVSFCPSPESASMGFDPLNLPTPLSKKPPIPLPHGLPCCVKLTNLFVGLPWIPGSCYRLGIISQVSYF